MRYLVALILALFNYGMAWFLSSRDVLFDFKI